MCLNIMAHLDEHKLLLDRQHAFRKIHSCETQLTMVINDWAKFWTIKHKVDAFILDFENSIINSLKVNSSATVQLWDRWNNVAQIEV